MRSVEAVLKAQSVPVNRGVHVALVLDVDHDLGALLHLEDGPRDRAVVGQHPDCRLAQALGHGGHSKLEFLAVCQFHELGCVRLRKARGVCRKMIGVVAHVAPAISVSDMGE